MRWYHLRDRRHEGPFTREEIIEGLKAGRIDSRDYLLPQQADVDQKSFAYMTAADVVGPEFMYEFKASQSALKKEIKIAASAKSVLQNQNNSSGSSLKSDQKLEALKSEFDEGIESTQLVKLNTSESVNQSAIEIPEDSRGFEMPWKWLGVLATVAAIAFVISQPDLWQKAIVSVKKAGSSVVSRSQNQRPQREANSVPSEISRPGIAGRPATNRVPSSKLQLPDVQRREEIAAPRSEIPANNNQEEIAPQRRVRGKSARDRELKESTGEDEDRDPAMAGEEESFDEGETVDNDLSVEEENEVDI